MVRQSGQFDDIAKRSFPETEEAAIRATLKRILASAKFVASARSSQFLSYIIEETLAGRSDRIKAFSIGVDVFERDEKFDAQEDPVVRVEAGRLRRKLEQYYQGHGKEEPVFIGIPLGGYVPRFDFANDSTPSRDNDAQEIQSGVPFSPPRIARSWRGLAAIAVLAALVAAAGVFAYVFQPFRSGVSEFPQTGPRIIVLPFRDLGEGATSSVYAAALIDDIITNLGRNREITVLGVQTSHAAGVEPDLSVLRRELGVNYALEGSVRITAERMHVTARLIDTIDSSVLWSRKFDNQVTRDNLVEVQQQTADSVAVALAEPYGVVFDSELARRLENPASDTAAYLCTLEYYIYRGARTAARRSEVRDCLEKAVKDFPEYSTAWALLAYIYIDEDRYGGDASGGSLPRSLEAAREAMSHSPNDIRALQAYMMALYFNNNHQEAFRIGEQALALNPSDPEIMGQLGLINAMAGSAERGRNLLEAALQRNPRNAGYYHGILAMGAYMNGEYDRALVKIGQANKNKVSVYSHLVAAMIYAQTGKENQARTELAQFERLVPNFIPNLWHELDRRGLSKDRQDRVIDGLRKAGATLPERPNAS